MVFLPPIIDAGILWVHLFSAVLFVGGSFFMWLVVMPVSHQIAKDESERTQMVGKIAKGFGKMSNILLAILVLTGIFNASWYLPSMNSLLNSTSGLYLLTKMILVVVMIVLIYTHNVYFGRRIVRLARERKLDELKALRRTSRIVSFTNLGLMVAILILAVMLQIPP